LQYVLPSVLGLIGGVVGSLVAPWVQWAVEKRRGRTDHRRALIKTWRNDFQEYDFDRHRLGDSAAYTSLRPHLRAEVREAIEKPRTAYVPNEGRGDNVKQQMLLDEVTRLERKWGLV
jgi:hypothetical protein